MLSINYINNNKEELTERLKIKNFQAEIIIADILELDTNRKTTQKELDDVLFESKGIAKNIGLLFKEGKTTEANDLKKKTGQLKISSKELSEKLSEIEQAQKQLLLQIPNIPHISVPTGKSETDNILEFEKGEIPTLDSQALPHWDIIKKLDIVDFETGNKVSGAGFPFFKGKGARLQRALINFFLDNAVNEGYSEMQPPIVINEDSGFGTGQLPDKDGQMYHINSENLYLIPTAEVPVTNYFRNKIININEFPIKVVAYTPCFRREAGSWGKDVRGLNRLHQFDKVEIVHIEHPDKSYETLDKMCNYVSRLLDQLELPYRKLRLCGGDTSFTAALTFDFEVYSAAQERWLEVSSVSNFESFQSNRLKLRFKDKDNKMNQAHTLNGSALALPRIMAALLENNQKGDIITIPSALQKYTGFEYIS